MLSSYTYFKITVNTVFIAVILLISYTQAEKKLRAWHGPGGSITTDLYIPSIMFACGKGFVNTDPQQIPELRKFLNFNLQFFNKEFIPSNLTTLDLDQYQQYHRYLIYAVGFLWRLTGVSWESLRLTLAFIYSLSALLVFAIARIYIIGILAFFVALLYINSEPPIIILPILRDFARAVFILSTIFLLCLLTSKKHSTKTQIFLSIILGLVNGIGIGFRRDQMMFLILSIIITLLPVHEKFSPQNIAKRIILSTLITIIFLFTSYPILKSFQKYGTLGFHDTLMGFGIESDDLAGLARTNYIRIPTYNDLLITILADRYTYNSQPLPDYISKYQPYLESSKKRLILAYILWFPADILIRTYSAIARILDKILPSPLPINMNRVYLSLLSLILFIVINPQKAIPFSLILFFSSATQSLQFSFRHNFYLSFVPPLLYSLLCQWILLLLFNAIIDTKNYLKMLAREFLPFGKKILLITSISIITILLPLQTLRLIQSHLVNKLFTYYLTSEITPIPFKEITTPNTTYKLYALQKPLHPFPTHITDISRHFYLTYLVVDLTTNSSPLCLDLLYDGNPDLSCTLPIQLDITNTTNSSPTTIRYFIPIAETYANENDWNRFIGIKINNPNEINVKNIYKICNPEKIPLPIFFYISEKHTYIPYQQIAKYTIDQKMINPCWQPYGISKKKSILHEAIQKTKSSQLKESLQILQQAYETEPYHIEYLITAGKLLKDSNNIHEALHIYKTLLKQHPYESLIGIFIENLFKHQNLPPAEIENKWKQITQEIPESPIAHYYYSMHISDITLARDELLTSLQSYPELTTTHPFVAELLTLKEILDLLLESPTQSQKTLTTKCHTTSTKELISFLVTSAIPVINRGDHNKAKQILTLLLNICPDLPHIYPPLITLHTMPPSKNPFLATYYAKTLIDLKPYDIEPIDKLESIYTNTQFIPTEEWISIWKDLQQKHPDSPCILCGLGRAFEISGNIDSAETTYIRATKKSKKNDSCIPLAYYRLVNLYINKNELHKAKSTLNQALKYYPNNSALLTLHKKLNPNTN